MIGGFELPTGGRIELRGRDVTHDPPDKRPVNMVFQNYALFPHLDVGGQHRVRAAPRRTSSRTRSRGASARRSSSSTWRATSGASPTSCRGGQQQRVALARALVNRPNVLLLDEPLGALDLKLRRQLQVELKRVQAEVGITFVYVTHDQEEALTMSDRIAVMHRGRVEQLGTPEELYERPATRFVADFIGTTNLLTGSVESADAAIGARPAGRRRRVSSSPGAACASGQAVELSHPPGIRRHARPRTARRPTASSRSRRQVEQVAYLGGSVQYHVRTRGGLAITVLAPKTGRAARRSEATSTSPGRRPRPWSSAGDRRRGGGPGMNDRYDGSSIDLEKALVRYMVERRITPARAARADRARSAAAAALAPVIAACTSGGARARRQRLVRGAVGAPLGRHPRPRRRRPPSPSPEAELNIYNWTDYLADEVIESFEDQYGIKVTQSFFSTTDEMYAKLGDDGGGYDISFPISVDVPNMIERGVIAKLDKSLLPNIGNLGAEWANPGYDPGNAVLGAVHVVDDRRRLRPGADQRRSRRARRRSGTRAGRSTSRCSTTGRRSSGWR